MDFQQAVDPQANLGVLGCGLDVDVRYAAPYRFVENLIDQRNRVDLVDSIRNLKPFDH